MKLWMFAVAGAVALAGAATWLLQPTQHPEAGRVTRPTVPTAASAVLPPEAAKGRLVLSKVQVDEALASGTIDRPVKSLLAVQKPLHFGDFAWNDKAIPAGPDWVRIDLGSQLISVFRAGHEIGTAVIVYGGNNKETPAGTFHILSRDKDHRSSLYDAKMPYTLQLTNDGVSIHGSDVRWGAATHGCIGVPIEFARRLFEQARVGDEVVIIPPSAGQLPQHNS